MGTGTTEKTGHTPTPWEIRPNDQHRWDGFSEVCAVYNVDSNPTGVAIIGSAAKLLVDACEKSADAEFIIRAVNAHDELLAACETALRRLHAHATGDVLSEDESCDACADLEAAIAKAEGNA